MFSDRLTQLLAKGGYYFSEGMRASGEQQEFWLGHLATIVELACAEFRQDSLGVRQLVELHEEARKLDCGRR